MDKEHFNLLKVSLDVAKNELEKLHKRHKDELKAASDNVAIATKTLEDYVRDSFSQDIRLFLGDAPVVINPTANVSSIDEMLEKNLLECSIFGTALDESNAYIQDDYICIHVKEHEWLAVYENKSCPSYINEQGLCRQGFSNRDLANNKYLLCYDFEDIRRIFEQKFKEYIEYVDGIINEFLGRCEGAKLYLGEDGDGYSEWFCLHAIHKAKSCCVCFDFDDKDRYHIGKVEPCKNSKPVPDLYGGHGAIIKEVSFLRYKRMLTAVKLHIMRRYASEVENAKKFFEKCAKRKKCEK